MEIEARVPVKNLRELRQKLESFGVVFSKETHQFDKIYKPKGKKYVAQAPGDFILRIRRSDKNYLTYKALTENAGIWIEHETQILNADDTEKILLKTGFSVAIEMTKNRVIGKLENLEISLDNIKQLGSYMEIEIISENENEAKNKIIKFLKKLGFSKEEIIHKGYVALLFEKKGVIYKNNSG